MARDLDKIQALSKFSDHLAWVFGVQVSPSIGNKKRKKKKKQKQKLSYISHPSLFVHLKNLCKFHLM